MILILSEYEDTNTDEVCEWLNYFEVKFIRLNESDIHYTIDICISNKHIRPTLNINEKNIHFSEFSTVWFRRGRFSTQSNFDVSCFQSENDNYKTINHIQNFLFREFNTLSDYLYWHLKQNAKCFNFPSVYNINKLMVLECAVEAGLNIPNSLVTSSKEYVTEFFDVKEIITKSISDWDYIEIEDMGLSVKINNIDKSDIKSDSFFYSFFQNKIEKLFEVRTFIWDNKTYSAAIYHPKNYSEIRENKIIPYQIPENIEHKLLKCMSKLGLESGSVDLLVDKDSNFHFLEVNPVGQFDFVDKNCNYNLAKIIAETLIRYENN